MTEVFTNLERPPEYRGDNAESYCRELFRWLVKYHIMLEALVKSSAQLKADIAALGELTQDISNPPTQAEVQAIQDKLNALIQTAVVT